MSGPSTTNKKLADIGSIFNNPLRGKEDWKCVVINVSNVFVNLNEWPLGQKRWEVGEGLEIMTSVFRKIELELEWPDLVFFVIRYLWQKS